jgi:hypothetical protein
MVLPYLHENGWEAEVLAVEPAGVAAPRDVWLADGLPPAIPIHRVKALGLRWTSLPGLGNLGFRALNAMKRAGDRLLSETKFDLLYFSTTQWPVHLLGPRWKGRFGVPFAMDYQDPWVSDYYRTHPELIPPGGRIKYALATLCSRWMEPWVLRHCAGITSVSAGYPIELRNRYPFLAKNWPVEVLPFPGDSADLARATENNSGNGVAPDGLRHWVYVGRGGEDMGRAARSLFSAISTHAKNEPGFADSLRVHFFGTSYAAAGKGAKTIEPLAREFGLEKIVAESTNRLSYSDTLYRLATADALIVLGSDDPTYTASKIYPYLLTGKPLLAIFHERSSVVDLMNSVGGGMLVAFGSREPAESVGARIRKEWLESGSWQKPIPLDRDAFGPYTAKGSAKRLADFWHLCRTQP